MLLVTIVVIKEINFLTELKTKTMIPAAFIILWLTMSENVEKFDDSGSISQATNSESAAMDTLYRKVRRALKCGLFSTVLRQDIDSLDEFMIANGRSLAERDEVSYLKVKSMLAEAYDYFGVINSSDELRAEGAKVFDQLKVVDVVHPNDRQINRERIRFCLNHANAFFYREYKFDLAKERVLWCRDFITERLREEQCFPCHGTLAQAEFYLGNIYRRLNQYSQAEECFVRAIGFYYERAKRKKDEYGTDPSKFEILQEDLAFSRYKLAICLGIGMGWVSFTKGNLREAIHHNILPARVLLMGTEDRLHTAYLDLLFNAATRSADGRRGMNLSAAIENITRAYEVFREHKHIHHAGNALLELSLAYFYNDNLLEAQAILARLEMELRGADESRWRCPRLLIASRIRQRLGDYIEADRLVSHALVYASETKQIPYHIEALIVRSETSILLGRMDSARADLSRALELNVDGKGQSNPKVEAICYLHLARSYALDHNGRDAERYFARWKQLEQRVEHGVIRQMARDIEKEIECLRRDFVIRADTDNLSYGDHLKALQRFLVNQAMQRGQTIQEATKTLKISRQTLHQWQKEKGR